MDDQQRAGIAESRWSLHKMNSPQSAILKEIRVERAEWKSLVIKRTRMMVISARVISVNKGGTVEMFSKPFHPFCLI